MRHALALGTPKKKSFGAMFCTAEQYGWDPVFQYSGHTVLGSLDFGGSVRLSQGECEGARVIESFRVKVEQKAEKRRVGIYWGRAVGSRWPLLLMSML
jgi:hypothetical protein